MKDWKAGLDRYLTASPPDDPYEGWAEEVVDEVCSELFQKHEDFLLSNDSQCNEWLNRMFSDKGLSPSEATALLERCLRVYEKHIIGWTE